MESDSDPDEKPFCSSQPLGKSMPQSLANDDNDALSTDNNPPIVERAVVDNCDNNKVTVPKNTPKIPSVESEDISITSTDIIPKVEPDDDYIVVVAAFPPGTNKAKKL